MSTLLSFPGQGAQQVGMLHRLESDSLMESVLLEASDVLAEDVLLLDTEQALTNTRAVQLCLLINGVASARRLLANDAHADYTAGLSIGAYAAAVTAGILSFKDALELVSLRGRLMQDAYPVNYSMIAVQGISFSELEQFLILSKQRNQEVYLANINADDQYVLAGKVLFLDVIAKKIKKNSVARINKINISVPSHCQLLYEQAETLYEEMLNVTFNMPKLRYLSGSTARLLIDPEKIREDLAFNMARVINWQAVLESAFERGVRLHIELEPGSVLTNLGKRVIPNAVNISYQGNKLETLNKLMKKEINKRII